MLANYTDECEIRPEHANQNCIICLDSLKEVGGYKPTDQG